MGRGDRVGFTCMVPRGCGSSGLEGRYGVLIRALEQHERHPSAKIAVVIITLTEPIEVSTL